MNPTLPPAIPPPAPEPGWKTYLRAGLFIVPPLICWKFACVVMVPKVRELWNDAGLASQESVGIWNTLDILVQHGSVFLAGLVILLMALDFYSLGWRAFRRFGVDVILWGLNVAILVGLVSIGLLALLAAPGALHPR